MSSSNMDSKACLHLLTPSAQLSYSTISVQHHSILNTHSNDFICEWLIHDIHGSHAN